MVSNTEVASTSLRVGDEGDWVRMCEWSSGGDKSINGPVAAKSQSALRAVSRADPKSVLAFGLESRPAIPTSERFSADFLVCTGGRVE